MLSDLSIEQPAFQPVKSLSNLSFLRILAKLSVLCCCCEAHETASVLAPIIGFRIMFLDKFINHSPSVSILPIHLYTVSSKETRIDGHKIFVGWLAKKGIGEDRTESIEALRPSFDIAH